MKKLLITIALLFALIAPSFALAAEDNLGLIKPDSKLYFLQTWGESAKAALIINKEKKTDYLLELSDRRTAEIENYGDKIDSKKLEKITESYQKNFTEIETNSAKLKNKEEIDKKIAEANTRQQEVLQKVYDKVPEEAKAAIRNAQTNSSKSIQKILEENPELLQNYSAESAGIIEGKARSQIQAEIQAKVEVQAKSQAEALGKAQGEAAAVSQAAAAQASAQAQGEALKAQAEAGQITGGATAPTAEQIEQYKSQAASAGQSSGQGGVDTAALEAAARQQAAQQYGQ